MNYRFSRLASFDEKDNKFLIEAHMTSSTIELHDPCYVSEFRAILHNGGTDQVNSELEHALVEHNVLIESDINDIDLLTEEIEKAEQRSYMLIILPTEQCNLRCAYCYEKFHSDVLTQAHYDLLTNEVKSALEDGKSDITIAWFGGEPLLRTDDILRFTSRIRDMSLQKGAKFHSGITTNGILLDKMTLNALCENGVTDYQITLDGYSHDKQRVFADGSGSFDRIFNNIKNMLDSELDFKLTLRVNITEGSFDFSFYDLFRPYASDKRLSFHVMAVGRWSDVSNNLTLFSDNILASKAIELHENHLRGLGFICYNDSSKSVLSRGCYAARRDMFVIRASGRIAKCTVALDDEINDIGYLDLEKGEMVIDYNLEEQWSYNPLSLDCHQCKKLAICCNRSCPLAKLRRRDADRCCELIK